MPPRQSGVWRGDADVCIDVRCTVTARDRCLAICGGAQFHERGASADPAPLGGEESGCCAPLPAPRAGGVTGCGTGVTPPSPRRLWWEAYKGQPCIGGLRGMFPRQFDLGEDAWKWGGVFGLVFQAGLPPPWHRTGSAPRRGAGPPFQQQRQVKGRQAVRRLSLSSLSIRLSSLHHDCTFTCRVVSAFSPALHHLWCTSFGTPWLALALQHPRRRQSRLGLCPAQHSGLWAGFSSVPCPQQGNRPSAGLGLPQGGSGWAGRSPGSFKVSSRWFRFNAFNCLVSFSSGVI